MSDETLKKEGFSKFWTKDKTQALLGNGLIRTVRTIILHGPSIVLLIEILENLQAKLLFQQPF